MKFNKFNKNLKRQMRLNNKTRGIIALSPPPILAALSFQTQKLTIKEQSSTLKPNHSNLDSRKKIVDNKKKILLELIKQDGWNSSLLMTDETKLKQREKTRLTDEVLRELSEVLREPKFKNRFSSAITQEYSLDSLSPSSESSDSSSLNLENEFQQVIDLESNTDVIGDEKIDSSPVIANTLNSPYEVQYRPPKRKDATIKDLDIMFYEEREMSEEEDLASELISRSNIINGRIQNSEPIHSPMNEENNLMIPINSVI